MIVERSINIDPSEGSYLIRRECKANDLDSSSSIYFNDCPPRSVTHWLSLGHGTRSYSGKATGSIIVASEKDFD